MSTIRRARWSRDMLVLTLRHTGRGSAGWEWGEGEGGTAPADAPVHDPVHHEAVGEEALLVYVDPKVLDLHDSFLLGKVHLSLKVHIPRLVVVEYGDLRGGGRVNRAEWRQGRRSGGPLPL